jgi:hypothetical protein
MNWNYLGGLIDISNHEMYAKTHEMSYVFLKEEIPDNYIFRSEIKLEKDGEAGVFFNVKATQGIGSIVGYYFSIDSTDHTIYLKEVNEGDGETTLLAKKRCPFKKDIWYSIVVDVAENRMKIYFNNFCLENDLYPKFDFYLESYMGGSVGLCFGRKHARFRNISVTDNRRTDDRKVETYTNPLVYGADPDILYHDGVYYLYYTDTADMSIFQCYTSNDLVNWSKPHIVFHQKDGWGYRGFMSPNVIYFDGVFYMFYAALSQKGKRRISYATSKSPLGPFTNPEQTTLHGEIDEIGGHPFIDDNGRCYLTVVRFNNGNEVWAMEIRLEKRKVTVLEDTVCQLLVATESWEKDYANIVEGGVIMKHKGLYYMMYAGGHYKGNYGEGYAISKNPLGPYEKYAYNPILESNYFVAGTGDSVKTLSPDGKEIIMFYHQHYSPRKIAPRWICCDRMEFIQIDDGPDVMVVHGPTVTPQPVPSSD